MRLNKTTLGLSLAVAFVAGIVVSPMAHHLIGEAHAQAAPLQPTVIDLMAIKHADLPTTPLPEMNSKGLVTTDNATIAIQSGNVAKHNHPKTDEIQYIIEGTGAMWLGNERKDPVVSTFAMPDAIPLPDAAALYFPFHLAWLGLYDRADLQAGESVLIHAAAGGSGSAAIQLAKHRGARVFATAGSAEKVELCRSLGADVAIDYNTDDFAAVVLEATEKRGVDVVFDNVGEAVMEQSMRCTAYNGRYLMMGFASNKVVADEPFVVPRRVALGNFKLCGVLLAYAPPAMSELVKDAMGWNFASEALGERIAAEIVDLVLSGSIKPVIGRTVAFEELPAAMEAMANRETVGRVVALVD